MVLAARGKARRDRALVEADRARPRAARERSRRVLPGEAGLLEHLRAAPPRSPCSPPLARELARRPGGRRSRSRGPAGSVVGAWTRRPRAAAASPGCARPPRRPCGRPRRRAAAASSLRAREGVDDEVAARVRAALAIDPVELGAARQAAALAARRGPPPATATASAACGPCAAAALEHAAGRRAYACGHGTRACGRACASWAGRCASSRGHGRRTASRAQARVQDRRRARGTSCSERRASLRRREPPAARRQAFRAFCGLVPAEARPRAADARVHSLAPRAAGHHSPPVPPPEEPDTQPTRRVATCPCRDTARDDLAGHARRAPRARSPTSRSTSGSSRSSRPR